MKIETGINVDDCQSGFRLYPVQYISKLHFRSSHYNFETEILTRAAWAGLPIVNVPIHSYYPKPEDRISHFHPIRDNILISFIHLHLLGIRLLPFPRERLLPCSKMNFSKFHPRSIGRLLFSENTSPGQLAIAAFIGTLIAMFPLWWGIRIVLILYAATRLHVNKMTAFLIQWIFALVFFPVLCIQTGSLIIHGNLIKALSWNASIESCQAFLKFWWAGSIVLCIPTALLSAGVFYMAAHFFQSRRKCCQRSL